MSREAVESAPKLGEAQITAPSLAAVLRRNASDPLTCDRPAIRMATPDGTADRTWTHAEYYATCCRWANLLLAYETEAKPLHLAVLLDNGPDYLFAFGAAALAGGAVVGINHTRGGEHLLHDVFHTDCVAFVHDPRHAELTNGVLGRLPNPLALGGELDAALASVSGADPECEAPLDDPWALIFTSGTSSAPKAVICSQRRILTTGARMAALMDLTPDDVGYVSMPLFHSNSVMVGWAPSVIVGASVALAPRFSASGWLPDVRRYGATYFNYTGKPLAYILSQPEHPDDADNTVRVAYGNEGAPQVVDAFAQRFGVFVIDGFGATEGGLAVTRTDDAPPGSVGLAGPEIRIIGDDGSDLPPATLDETGGLVDPVACVGEIVNIAGVGVFEGYYNNPEANERATRNGWYWSGDLGYLDPDGYLYFAGRTADWIRVDGENFPTGPIEVILGRHPDVLVAAAYGVPDPEAGDRVMATLVLRDGASFDPAAFATWVDAQPDLSPKWRPAHVRVTRSIPTSPTNKVLVRVLSHQKYRPDRVGGDPMWVRGRGEDHYRRFDEPEAQRLRQQLEHFGRARFWDL